MNEQAGRDVAAWSGAARSACNGNAGAPRGCAANVWHAASPRGLHCVMQPGSLRERYPVCMRMGRQFGAYYHGVRATTIHAEMNVVDGGCTAASMIVKPGDAVRSAASEVPCELPLGAERAAVEAARLEVLVKGFDAGRVGRRANGWDLRIRRHAHPSCKARHEGAGCVRG